MLCGSCWLPADACLLYRDFWKANGGKLPEDDMDAVCLKDVKDPCQDWTNFEAAQVGRGGA